MVNRYTATSSISFKINIIKDKLCTFCKREEETIEHVFYDCDIVLAFWLDFESFYRDECMTGHLKQKDVSLGDSCNNLVISTLTRI